MSLTEFLAQGLSLVGTFNPKIMVFLFLLCFIGEVAGLFVPYLLEATWLLVGYQFSARVLPLPDLILLMLTTQAGRQSGSLALYYIGRRGGTILTKYQKYFRRKTEVNDNLFFRLFRKINIMSPFAVALGRLLWLRLPLTLMLGAKGKLKVLLLGVALSSLVYDGIYIILGAVVGTTTVLQPGHLILYSLAGLTVMYGVTFALRRLIGNLTKRRRLEAAHRSN